MTDFTDQEKLACLERDVEMGQLLGTAVDIVGERIDGRRPANQRKADSRLDKDPRMMFLEHFCDLCD